MRFSSQNFSLQFYCNFYHKIFLFVNSALEKFHSNDKCSFLSIVFLTMPISVAEPEIMFPSHLLF